MPAPAAGPSVEQAFTLDMYFNSGTTDSLDTPVPKHGLAVPSPWGTVPPGTTPQGYRAWRREWRAWNPGQGVNPGGSPYWNPGLRKLIVGGASAVNSNYYAAQGQVFTINLWDLKGPLAAPPSTATSAYIQVAAYQMINGQPSYINPPFSNYCWGGYSNSTPISSLPTFPGLPTGQTFVQISQAAATPVPSIVLGAGGHQYQSGPNTQQTMNVAALISLVFANQISASSPIHLEFAVYTTLTPSSGPAKYCFDDPEMDVDMGS